MTWEAGQHAAIGRREIVTIDRVTPSGRAIVGNRVFNTDGSERGVVCHVRLEPLTDEIEAEIAFVKRGRLASDDVAKEQSNIRRWAEGAFYQFRRQVPTLRDVETAERLTAAIRDIMRNQSNASVS